MEERKCLYCRKIFQTDIPGKKYCCRKCSVLDTGEADKRRMPDCPIKCKRGRERRKKVYRKK